MAHPACPTMYFHVLRLDRQSSWPTHSNSSPRCSAGQGRMDIEVPLFSPTLSQLQNRS